MAQPIIICESKVWDKQFVNNLKEALDRSVIHITDKHKLNLNDIREINPEYIFFPHWSYIIPKEIFSNYQCIVFHMTDLPYGRGGSPLQNLILAGKKKTKISAIDVVEEIDAGDIFLKKDLSLSGHAQDVFNKANKIIQEMIIEIVTHSPTPIPQDGTPTYFKRRQPNDSDISQLDNLELVYDYIRMLDAEGYPLAYMESDSLKFEFQNVSKVDNELTASVRITKK
jgi:methionyl-tRNA formyltransferase